VSTNAGVGLGGTYVQEVDLLPVDLGEELWVGVQGRLLRPPVVGVAPVRDQVAEVAHRDAGVPVVAWERCGKASAVQACGEVVQVGLIDVDAEGADALGRVHAGILTCIADSFCPPCPAE